MIFYLFQMKKMVEYTIYVMTSAPKSDIINEVEQSDG